MESKRKLRQIEDDYIFASNQMEEEMVKKNELLEMMEKTGIASYEVKSRELWAKSDERIREIQKQKEAIEEALQLRIFLILISYFSIKIIIL